MIHYFWTFALTVLTCIQVSVAQSNTELSNVADKLVDFASRPDSCAKYLPIYNVLASSIENDYLIEKAKLYEGICLIEGGDYDEGKDLLMEFLAIAEAASNRTDMAFTYFQLSTDRNEQADPETYLNYINQAIDLYTEVSDLTMLSRSLGWKSVLLRKQRLYAEAEQVLDQAWASAEASGDSTLMAETLNAQAILIIASKSDFKKAAALFERQSEINRKVDDLEGLATSLGNLGFAHIRMNELDIGEKYIREASLIKEKIGNPYEVAMANIQLSEINVLRKKWDESEKYNDRALEMSIEHSLPSIRQQAYQQRSYILDNQNKHKEALNYYKQYADLKDSLLNEKIVENTQKVEAAYDLLKKEEEINELEKADILKSARLSRQRLALGGTTVGLGLLSFLLYRLFGQKRQIESQNEVISTALTEKETLLKEIHHRVKNNMQVISSLLRIQSNQTQDAGALEALKEGQSRVQSMSLIHQDLYQHDNLTGIHMPDYIEKLGQNLLQTYQLSPDQVHISTDIDELTLDVDTVVPLGLIINELVTNSLKYAFPDGRSGAIRISLAEAADHLQLVVSDDGVGMSTEEISEGYGSGLIRAFAQKLDAEIEMESIDGTTVSLSIRDYHQA